MNRSPMPPRKKPLEPKTSLKRMTALNVSPMARSVLHAQSAERRKKASPCNTGPTAKVRALVHVRSGGWCEWPGCLLAAVDVHHRRPRRLGGSTDPATNKASNLVDLCRPCHEFVERHRLQAIEQGFLLHAASSPRDVPARTRHGLVLLNDDGSWEPCTEVTS